MSIRVGASFAGLAALLGSSPQALADTDTGRLLNATLDSYEFLFARNWQTRVFSNVLVAGNAPGVYPGLTVPDGKGWLIRYVFSTATTAGFGGDTISGGPVVTRRTDALPFYRGDFGTTTGAVGVISEATGRLAGPIVLNFGDAVDYYAQTYNILIGPITCTTVVSFAEFDSAI